MIKNTTAFAGAALIATLAAAGTVGAQNQGPPPRVQAVLVMNEFAEAIPVVVQAPERTAFTLKVGSTRGIFSPNNTIIATVALPEDKRFVVENVIIEGEMHTDGWPDATLVYQVIGGGYGIPIQINDRQEIGNGRMRYTSSYRTLFYMDSVADVSLVVANHHTDPTQESFLYLTGYLVDLPEE